MNLLKQFYHKSGAAAAVEFAFVFPIFVALWGGVTEITQLQAVQTKTNNMAYVIANLASSLTSGDTSQTHPLTGQNYDGRTTFEALPGVADKLAGSFARNDGASNGVFIAAINRCPGDNNLTTVFTITEGNAAEDVNGTLPPTTLNEGEGIYYVAVQQRYPSLIGNGLFSKISNNTVLAGTRRAFYIVMPRTGGLIQDFTGDTRC